MVRTIPSVWNGSIFEAPCLEDQDAGGKIVPVDVGVGAACRDLEGGRNSRSEGGSGCSSGVGVRVVDVDGDGDGGIPASARVVSVQTETDLENRKVVLRCGWQLNMKSSEEILAW